MTVDRRRVAVAVALAGFACFINLYAPQALLPSLARDFGTGAADTSMTITATTLAVAMIAPFTGAVSDVLGRRRVIVAATFALLVPTLMVALSPSLHWMIFWLFVQGLALPPIFVVTVAYIGEEWSPAQAVGVAGLYTSVSGVGGFCGRFITGLVADLASWQAAFLSLAVLTFALAVGIAVLLPAEQRFSRSHSLVASGRQMLRHFRNPLLVATYAIGFGVLFSFIATFTYLNFYLAAAPFNLSATLLGSIFVIYLLGSVVTSMTGRLVTAFGRQSLIVATIAVWICGLAVTLIPSLPVILLGLTLATACGFLCQAVSTAVVAVAAKEGHSSAVGLYVTCYYAGGTVGGALPGLIWSSAGWPGCVAMVAAALTLMGLIVRLFWREAARA